PRVQIAQANLHEGAQVARCAVLEIHHAARGSLDDQDMAAADIGRLHLCPSIMKSAPRMGARAQEDTPSSDRGNLRTGCRYGPGRPWETPGFLTAARCPSHNGDKLRARRRRVSHERATRVRTRR